MIDREVFLAAAKALRRQGFDAIDDDNRINVIVDGTHRSVDTAEFSIWLVAEHDDMLTVLTRIAVALEALAAKVLFVDLLAVELNTSMGENDLREIKIRTAASEALVENGIDAIDANNRINVVIDGTHHSVGADELLILLANTLWRVAKEKARPPPSSRQPSAVSSAGARNDRPFGPRGCLP